MVPFPVLVQSTPFGTKAVEESGIAPIRLFWCAVGQEIDDIISKAFGNIVSYKENDETSEGEWKMQIDK